MNWFLMSLGLLMTSSSAAQASESWPFPDDDLEARIAEVSEGELILLEKVPDRPVHHHLNRIEIDTESLEQGWVGLQQCHTHLDPVDATQIVYHPARIRNIQIISVEQIEQVRIDGPSVQLTGIGRGARLCLQAESRALTRLGSDRFRLRNGPYMRRFLDGYYPMHVTLEITYPADALKLQDLRPIPGRAGNVQRTDGQVIWDSWFKGKLYTEFDFQRRQP